MEAALTLLSFHDEYYAWLFLCDARPRTFEAYRDTLKHWRRITGDPVMPFGAAVLAAFKVELHAHCSAATVNKHLRQVNAILAKAGPAGPGNRDALGMVDATPWTRPLREERPRPRAVPDELVAAIYAACSIARKPAGKSFSSAAWWRALLTMAITTAFRTSKRGTSLILANQATDTQ